MRIRMTVAMPEGSTRNGELWPALGEETDVPTADGAHLVASGVAEEVDEASPRGGRRKTAGKGAADASGADS
ncbi:hypothetical protein [Streptomyces antarcticus]|uniref:hypothetical protein n=1 Tax=Streptomyces antarcticus TaxID=2996458 RepID=UPI002271C56A|nr:MULTISPECIES: hypothetical protein [unclassified Streptomyces]MCY0943537.1 hypothetical protein [Streptomyces sp. H34-AA3]MCZ4083554.1 hypothetical protein [Streptomyces sp. H34-S5]